jgi:hydrogenase expression/formation protein HypE
MNTTPFTLSCPIPLRHYPQIVLGHGSGGQMMQELIEHLFIPAFGADGSRSEMTDAATLDLNGHVAFSTDSFVVNPPLFPGGNIGSLAVHGTVNDLAMVGAVPRYLSAAFVLEEGLPMETLAIIVYALADAAAAAGVRIVTGDTKVVERGKGDGIFINTTGIGVIPHGTVLSPSRIAVGDVLIVNGTLGDHGVAVMGERMQLGFPPELVSDSADLTPLVQTMLAASSQIHCLRDLTRGGLAAAANELARSANLGFVLTERAIPVKPAVGGACEILGLDVLQVANEGKLLAVVAQEDAEGVLAAMRAHPLGREAAIIGVVSADYPRSVIGRTAIGSQRVIDMPTGVLLPRIC